MVRAVNKVFQTKYLNVIKMVVRSYNDEMSYIEKINEHCFRIKKGFQPNMNVEGVFYVNKQLEKLMLDELRNSCRPGMVGGFLPGVKQIANVAALPGERFGSLISPKPLPLSSKIGLDIDYRQFRTFVGRNLTKAKTTKYFLKKLNKEI